MAPPPLPYSSFPLLSHHPTTMASSIVVGRVTYLTKTKQDDHGLLFSPFIHCHKYII